MHIWQGIQHMHGNQLPPECHSLPSSLAVGGADDYLAYHHCALLLLWPGIWDFHLLYELVQILVLY